MKQLAKALVSHQDGEELDPRFGLLNRWTFLMMQVFECKTFLALAEEECSVHPKSSLEEVLVQQALFRSAILAYGKCFAESGKNRSSLDKKKVFAANQDLLRTHERLIDLRNKFAAHNDTSGLDEAVIDVQEHDDEFVIGSRYAVANPLNEYNEYRQVLNVVEEFIVENTNKAIGSLQGKLGKRIRTNGTQ